MDESAPLTRLALAGACHASLLVVGLTDMFTGYEFVFGLFYALPVALCARYFGRLSVVLMALAGGLAWLIADKYSGHVYSREFYPYWNGFTVAGMSCLIGLMLHRLKVNLKVEAAANRELNRLLAEVRKSSEEITELRSRVQVVCAWSKQIKVEGKWITFDEFLTKHLHVQLSHGISPESLNQLLKEVGEKPKSAVPDKSS